MRRFLRPLAIVLAALLIVPAGNAFAITIVATVNGVPITSYDVEQRVALQRISGQTPSNSSATNELIDELVQLGEAIRLGVNVPQSQIDSAFASIAGQVQMSLSQFNDALRQSGIEPESLKRRLQAQIAWAVLMQNRIQINPGVRQDDVTAALLAQGRQTETVREYRLQQIIFVIPGDASAAVVNQRRSEAEAFRQRFAGCDGALAQAAALRGVVVVDIGRNASRLNQAQRDALETTQAGRTTRPERTSQGIEVIAVCSITEVAGNEAARVDITNQLIIQRGEQIGEDYLAELRARAIIQRF
ncbi:MAG: SurA N-terminal domain-containing protein [Bauldia sp.]|nr:SurA N-terminal domain-containing protein [Bauldia sp.]MCW5716660.1 SurA N-terminal domain-containing protein [Bauldia sp.]